jgi:hypothetical protein
LSPESASGIRIPNADSRFKCRSGFGYEICITSTSSILCDTEYNFLNISLLFKKSVYFKETVQQAFSSVFLTYMDRPRPENRGLYFGKYPPWGGGISPDVIGGKKYEKAKRK